MTSFSTFSLSEPIIKALSRINYTEATPVQKVTIPLILEGKDLIALAQTGSGKTAACAIPLCEKIDVSERVIQALVIVPTRELALQYATEAQKIGRDKGISVFALLGGEDYDIQRGKLKHGVHFLVATPGRLIDFIHGRSIDLSKVKTLVLDEADEMLSMGFYDDLEFIIQCLVHKPQILLYSATMPKQIRQIAMQHMQQPEEISLLPDSVSPVAIDHYFIWCHNPREKLPKLTEAIKELQPRQAIIFCRSRDECEMVHSELKKVYHKVDYLHAGQSQDIRTIVTNKFRSGKIHFLVATDVASRGLDFSGITHVFIYHLSPNVDLYLHRSGRTGRNEQKGTVATLVTERERGTVEAISKRLGKTLSWHGIEPPQAKASHHAHNPPKNANNANAKRPRRDTGHSKITRRTRSDKDVL
jgi:ATP-dependent RNA helicase DeaD